MAKPERLRFTILDDLILLREVSEQNPYEESDRWKTVAERVVKATQKNFSLRCVKEHVDHVLKIWAREGRGHLRKSGTEEQYIEKEQLLQQVQDLQREFRRTSKGMNSNAQKFSLQAKSATLEMQNIFDNLEVIIEEPMEEMSIPASPPSSTFLPIALPSPTLSTSSSSTSTPSTPQTSASPLRSPNTSPSRTGGPIRNKVRHDGLRKATWQFLQERHKKEVEFREKQFHLEERRIQLEEEKFKIERKEREARLQLEIEERKQRIAVSKQKQEILGILLQLIHKP